MTRRLHWPSDIGAKWRERLTARKRKASDDASKGFFATLSAAFAAVFSFIFFGGR